MADENTNEFSETIKALADGARDGIRTRGARFTGDIINSAIATNPIFRALKEATVDLQKMFKAGSARAFSRDGGKATSPIPATILTVVEGAALAFANMLAPIQDQEYRDAIRAHFLALFDEAQGVFDQEYADWRAAKNK